MSFPTHRPRRLRRNEALRGLVRETRLATSGLIYPMFVCPGTKVRQEVSSMPGIHQQSADQIVEECREVESLGIPGIILFGLPESKDPRGASSLGADGVVQRAIEAIRKAKLKLLVITDVCLCEYTDHGHCGVVEDGEVANDSTVTILAQQALSHARAGADIVAPSDMMDGRVGAIREILDEHKFENVAILSYGCKILFRLLRTIPGSGSVRSSIWRSAQLPDGPCQCAGSAKGSGARSRRRRGHDYGQAGASVS